MKIKALPLVALLCLLNAPGVHSQDVALKTNVLYDAALSPNLGIEFGMAPKWSFDLSGNVNAWTLSHGHRWKHWLAQPEARYWFCERFAGHFLAMHLLGGQYNIGGYNFTMLGTKLESAYRYQGWFAGAGIGYGYSWALSKHWNIEAEIAVGYAYTRYDKYECANCGKKVDDDHPHNYVGPTKAALNLVYVF
jgi:hypothetical protein